MLGGLGRLVLDCVLPPLCLRCQDPVSDPGTLCPTCWNAMAFIEPPGCACCGLPFDYDLGEGALCGACAGVRPRYFRARAVFRYDEASKPLILRLKHGDRLEGVPAFARWMARVGAELLADADLLVPVPLHRWRLFGRRYNQAALLAVALGRISGVASGPDVLIRRRNTPSQGHLSGSGRHRNVAGAFAVAKGGADGIRDRRLVLVDDVMTSGATVGECAKVLLAGGAGRVDVLTLARVVRVD